MTALCALGAASVISLVASACYLWWLLRDVPLARRAINLLMPVSQIAFVVCAYLLALYLEMWHAVAMLAAACGLACACLNPLFFNSLLAAERADLDAERADMLESQIAAQEHYALLMERTQARAREARAELDQELAEVERALARDDVGEARRHLVGAEKAVRTPVAPLCQHPVVAAILSAKAAWCAEQDIDLTVTADVPEALSTPDVELCALFANALDNAINACGELERGQRWITLAAHLAHGYFILEVENSCGGDAGYKPRPRTGRAASEVSRHGLGIPIMRDIAEHRDGNLAITRTAGTFKLSIIWKC